MSTRRLVTGRFPSELHHLKQDFRPLVLWAVLIGSLWCRSVFAQQAENAPILVLDAGGHTATVNRVVWTQDSRRLISVANDKTIRIWDVATGETARVLRPPIGPGPAGMLNAAALSSDGAWLAVAGYERVGQNHGIFVISLATGEVKYVLRGHTNVVLDLQFSRNGQWLASASNDNSARVWPIPPANGNASTILQGHKAPVYGVAFSPEGRRLVTASLDGTARIWTLPDGVTQRVLRGHDGAIQCVSWSPDGQTLATGGVDQSLRLWQPNGELNRRFEKLGNAVTSVSFSKDSESLLLTTGGPDAVDGGLLVDLKTNRERARMQHDNSVLHGALSPDGQLAATAGGNHREILVWRTSGGELKHRLEGRGRTPWAVAWGANDNTLVWGHTSREVSTNDRGPLEQTFDLSRLEFTSAPASAQRARVKNASWALEQKGDATVIARRDGRIQHTFKLARANELVRCYTLLSEHQVAIGGDYGLYLYSLVTGGLVREWRGHTGTVWAVAPSHEGQFLASAAEDQTLRVWSPERDDPVLSLFIASGDWIAWTPDGYYAASPGGERLMGWQINNGLEKLGSFHPAAQFRASLYRPEFIKNLLSKNGSGGAKPPGMQKVDVAELLPPRVKITSPTSGHRAAQNEIEVRATASSVGDHPVTSLRLLLDGRPYQGLRGIQKIADPKLGEVSGSWSIELDPGRHKLAVLASSAVSHGTSEEIEIVYGGSDSSDQVRLPKLYVVAIGISQYPGDLKLNYAAKDAESLSTALKSHGKPLFREVEMQVISDQQATRSAVLKGLSWLREQMTQNDYGIFFFAGHGELDNDGSLYFLPVDADTKDLLSSAVPAEQVKRALSGIPGKLITIIDACHSAGIAGSKIGKRRGDTPLTDDLIRDLVTDESGVVAMCSSTGREFSLENNEHRQGTFTLAIVEGLSGKADFNKDGIVYLNELDTYVTDRVKELTRGQQHPVTAKPGNVRSFPLSKP